jgi:hypothetical protein
MILSIKTSIASANGTKRTVPGVGDPVYTSDNYMGILVYTIWRRGKIRSGVLDGCGVNLGDMKYMKRLMHTLVIVIRDCRLYDIMLEHEE